jgi:glycerol-3-phosphate dehydrogenase
MLTVSSGVHVTLDQSFLAGDHAIMIPSTSDGRVLFAVPWQGHVILGTTDEPRNGSELEPRPLEKEVEFLLEHASHYLEKPICRADVLSVFTGLRPLVRKGNTAATKSLSRDHVIAVSSAALVTITGGKWTSYRKMAEDAVTRAAEVGGLTPRSSVTETLHLHGAVSPNDANSDSRFRHYGKDAVALQKLVANEPELGRSLHPRLAACAAEVVWAARHEMARSIDDVLSRRIRALQLDARAAIEAAPVAAELLAGELGRDRAWMAEQIEEFTRIARQYLPDGYELASREAG